MYLRILRNKRLKLRKRLKNLLAYYLKRRGANKQWRRYFKLQFSLKPEYNKPVNGFIEREHVRRWRVFNNRIDCATLRMTNKISGLSNPFIVPHQIFQVDLEPTLNNTPEVGYLAFKSIYNHWFPGKIFPQDFLHNIDGAFLNQNLEVISLEDAIQIAKQIEYPAVIKPNRDSYGGKGLLFPENVDEVIGYLPKNRNFLVQEKIKQHPFMAKLHPESLNTVRVYIYRSVSDNSINILNTTLRMGLGNSHVDNVTSGGIMAKINSDGSVCGFAIDTGKNKLHFHPDSGFDFKFQIPGWERLLEISKLVAQRILYARLIGLDVCYDDSGDWRMIEINLFSGSMFLSQNFGEPFFGEFSEEVYNYCKENHWALK